MMMMMMMMMVMVMVIVMVMVMVMMMIDLSRRTILREIGGNQHISHWKEAISVNVLGRGDLIIA